jgi:aquaglyceroporin related protein, other eukaryote
MFQLDYVNSANCFFAEFLCSFALILVIFAVTDKNNSPPPAGIVPIAVFAVIFGVSAGLGLQTGASTNPARDLGPRLMTAIVGYGEPGTLPCVN